MPSFRLVRLKNNLPNKKEIPLETIPDTTHQETNQPENPSSTAEIQIDNDITMSHENKTQIETTKQADSTVVSTNAIVDHMEIINSRPKEKIECPNCKKKFGTPLFMFDYTEGKKDLISCCPFCNKIIENKQLKETPIVETSPQSSTKPQETEKKSSVMQFQINSQELDELIRSTSYVK